VRAFVVRLAFGKAFVTIKTQRIGCSASILATGERTMSERPPANFETIVTIFVNQAYMGLGALKDEEGDPIIELPLAKHAIDLLGVLEEKTKGNLTAPERNFLENTLYEVRMRYLRIAQNPPQKKPKPEPSPDAAPNEATSAPSEEPPDAS